MKGRKPKPAALKLLQGNAGRRPIKKEIKVSDNLPKPPKHLGKEGKKEFKRLSKMLMDAGILDEIDGAALANYCQIWERMIEAEEKLRQTGMIVKSPKGYPMQSPYLQVINKCLEQIKFYLSVFGMTPSDRTRLSSQLNPKKEEKKDPLEELLGNG